MTRHANIPTALFGLFLAAFLFAVPGTVSARDGKDSNRQEYSGQAEDRNDDSTRDRGHYGSRQHREYDERYRHDERYGRRNRVEQERPSSKSLERWWRELPGNEQRRQMYDYDRYRQLDPERRDHVEDRWQRFRDLPPEQQDRLRHDYRRYQELPSGDQERLQRTWRRYQELPPAQQDQLKRELRGLRDLPDVERDRRRQELHRRYFPDPPPPRREK